MASTARFSKWTPLQRYNCFFESIIRSDKLLEMSMVFPELKPKELRSLDWTLFIFLVVLYMPMWTLSIQKYLVFILLKYAMSFNDSNDTIKIQYELYFSQYDQLFF